jgi:hypothetical protein
MLFKYKNFLICFIKHLSHRNSFIGESLFNNNIILENTINYLFQIRYAILLGSFYQ